jgi:predicted ATPase
MKQFEAFRLDTANECLWKDGEQISLPPKPFAVLRYLVEHPGRLITHDELLDALWPETYVQPQVLRTYMLELRKVLGDDAARPRFIQTLPKRGYCFVAPVTDLGSKVAETVAGPSIDRPSLDIVNRDDEMGRLRAQALLAANGQRQVVFITGGAGIGKSALVDAFCRHLDTSLAASVARGQCVEGLGKKEEYHPIMEALGQLCASADGERACRVLAKMAAAWLPTGRSVEGAQPSHRAPGDLCEALEELAQEKSLVLVFEDLHWADDSTLELISALARRRASAKLMVIATYRPQDGSVADPLKRLKQDLAMRRLGTEMVLAPLAKSAVKLLVSRQLGQEAMPAGLESFIYEHSEGNPLFVKAILEHLIAEKCLIPEGSGDAARWKQGAPFAEMEAGVPRELAQMIELEIDRLSSREQRLLEAASLTNVAFPAWAVAAALDEDIASAEEACDELARRLYFVQRAGQDELPDGTRSAFYVFAHGLYCEVLYQRQSVARRAKGHIRIAERLSALFVGRESSVAREMAMHYQAAGDWPRATTALRMAAKHAQQRQAHAEAAVLLVLAMQIAENLNEIDCTIVIQEVRGELAIVREEAEGTGTLARTYEKLDDF